MKYFLTIPALMILSFLVVYPLEAQQVTCTPSVTSTLCKQFDSNFGSTSMWPSVNFTKGIEIVIVDPSQFKAEKPNGMPKKTQLPKTRKLLGTSIALAVEKQVEGCLTMKF